MELSHTVSIIPFLQLRIIRPFKKPPHKIQILLLYFFTFFRNSKYTVPFIYNKDKSLPRLNKDLVKSSF